jgi:hypothetical protein
MVLDAFKPTDSRFIRPDAFPPGEVRSLEDSNCGVDIIGAACTNSN